MKNKDFLIICMAILIGILFGAMHAYSVASHRTSDVKATPTHYIEQNESNEMPLATDVKVIHKANDPDIPDEIEDACITYGKQYGISVEFLEALIWQESRFKADVVSDDGNCIGLCQINQKCHKKRMKRLGVTDLTDARQNIAVAADYLAEIFEEHPEPHEALMVYNGDGRWKNGKVSKYAKEIVLKSEELKVKHEQ